MYEKQRIIGAAGGAAGLGVFSALLATCCGVPLAVTLLGAAGAVALARLAFLLPFTLIGAFALLAFAFWWAYRQSAPSADGSCAWQTRRRLRQMVWAAAFVVAIMMALVVMPFVQA